MTLGPKVPATPHFRQLPQKPHPPASRHRAYAFATGAEVPAGNLQESASAVPRPPGLLIVRITITLRRSATWCQRRAPRPSENSHLQPGRAAGVAGVPRYALYLAWTSGCGAVGSALPWGGRGRGFESRQSDQLLLSNRYCKLPGHREHFFGRTPCRRSGMAISARDGAIRWRRGYTRQIRPRATFSREGPRIKPHKAAFDRHVHVFLARRRCRRRCWVRGAAMAGV